MEYKPSVYQSAIFQWGENWQPSTNLIVEALAGSGKTTTCVKMLDVLPSTKTIIMVAFNKHIATALEGRVPSNVMVKTYHALGLMFLSKSLGKIRVDADKLDRFLKKASPDWKYISPVKRLVSLCKAYLLEGENSDLDELCVLHNIDTNGDRYEIYNLVRESLNYSKNETWIVDFDDMCWLPIVLGIAKPICDMIIVDEVQDTNPVQLELAIRAVKSDGRIVGVGDRFQSIYGFRGADVNAIPNLIERLHADVLPLSITYRNPKSVVELVHDTFPHIPLECPDWAQDGLVSTIKESTAIDLYLAGDMVLCRTNAPLVKPCFELIRRGVKAIIKGRDIGSNLTSMIKRMKGENLNDMLQNLSDYIELEADKLLIQNKTNQYVALLDKRDTIFALSDGCETINDVITKISTIFSDDVIGVTFSSIHKAKGLEAERVFILHPELLPHPMAKQAWERQQESNMQYVAYTRTLKELYIVE